MLLSDYNGNYGTGWISLYRSIKDHWIWKNPIHLKIWIDFLMRANHKPNRVVIDGEFVSVIRGAFITSLKKLAKEYGVSIGKIRHFLELLENDSMILLKTTHKFTQITICNYETYQDGQQTERNQNEIRMKSKRNQNETDNNDNNVNNDNNKKEVVLYPVIEIKKEYFVDMLPIDSNQKFIEAWNEWCDFRREIKKKLTKLSAKKQITFLLNQPDPIKCINQSIQNGWTGLFEVSQKQSGKIIQNEYTYQELSEMSKTMGKEERIKFWDKYEIQENKKWKLKSS